MRSDEEVKKYIGGDKMQNPESLEQRLQFYISCYPQKIGLHATIWAETGVVIGWSGLQPLEDTGEIEVSYGLIREYWGRGIALEAARAWLKFGFGQLDFDRIVAVADKDNVASWKIMEKLGMRYEREEEHYGMECVVYAISKDHFESA